MKESFECMRFCKFAGINPALGYIFVGRAIFHLTRARAGHIVTDTFL